MLSQSLRELLEAVRRLPSEEQMALWSMLMRGQPASGEMRLTSVANLTELRFREGLRCPHCRSKEVVRYGRLGVKQRYRCKGCGRTFNDLTGTPMHKTLYPEKWPLMAQALRDGLTIEKTAELLGISARTAFAWRHKMLGALRSLPEPVLGGIVEADEAFFLRSEKGNRKLCRRARRRGGRARHRGRSREHVYALIARDRDGRTLSKKLDCITKDAIVGVLEGRIQPGSKLCSDGLGVYKAAASALGLEHLPVNLSRGIRVIRELSTPDRNSPKSPERNSPKSPSDNSPPPTAGSRKLIERTFTSFASHRESASGDGWATGLGDTTPAFSLSFIL